MGAIVSGKIADYIGRRGVSISITVKLYLVVSLSVKLQKDHKLFNFSVFCKADNGLLRDILPGWLAYHSIL